MRLPLKRGESVAFVPKRAVSTPSIWSPNADATSPLHNSGRLAESPPECRVWAIPTVSVDCGDRRPQGSIAGGRRSRRLHSWSEAASPALLRWRPNATSPSRSALLAASKQRLHSAVRATSAFTNLRQRRSVPRLCPECSFGLVAPAFGGQIGAVETGPSEVTVSE